ncbi:alpha-glucosidase [Occultella gossypii]|uniref:Alpha-glucosidase n=1 Tax=Occultella gossypii TaxID=2800820 RepID=A0ABS7S7M7_9MICO|nr:alpha-glucosidase [Occultella gossypii]MBZ2195296.1 alpha-glucosidase [Occultella gossypii]
MTHVEPSTRLKEIYGHPVGRDAIDKVLLQLGRSSRWVRNPVVANLRLRTVARLARPILGEAFAQSLVTVLADHGPDDEPTPDPPPSGPDTAQPPWWRRAVFYQVYPRSFADSDGDGVGDLRGVTARLDHLADLGVDCVWLSPIFDSPNEDMGYDVRDYRAVMAEMGTLADLDALIAGAHERGMRIILDLVVNHTSAEHPWFRAAVADPDGPYGDYYHLRPGAPGEDGSGPPPNNWASFFGGSAWRWIPQAHRWALHLFAPGQMDLNWDNPRVRAEVAEIVRWWRERGIDGFRLDVINYISKRPGLPDGNEAIGALMGFPGIEHYFFGPRLHSYLRELRTAGFTRSPGDPAPPSTVRSRHPDGTLGDPAPPDPVGVMVGETPGVGVEMARLLSGARRGELDLVFNFDVLDGPGKVRWDDYRYDLGYLKGFYLDYLARVGPDDGIALFLDNHDNPRMLSKVLGPRDGDPALRAALAKALATIQLMLPGTPFLFQGQEIAAVDQAFTSVADLRDVESLNRFAELRAEGVSEADALARVLPGARDHARVPMRWEPGPSTGFTTGTPWQAGREDSTGFTVAEQSADPASVLNFHRDLIGLRRAEPALTDGGFRVLAPGSRGYFGWLRTDPGAGSDWLIEVNLTDRTLRRPRALPRAQVVLGSPGTARGATMAPYECVVARVSSQR